MAGCIVYKTCSLHRTAANWLAQGQLGELRDHRDLFLAIAPRAWVRCTCGLWDRMTEAIGPLPTLAELRARAADE